MAKSKKRTISSPWNSIRWLVIAIVCLCCIYVLFIISTLWAIILCPISTIWAIICKHYKVSLFVTSVVVILHSVGLLNGLDALFLRFASSTVTLFSTSIKPEYIPVVFGIGNYYYEDQFKQTSPLDRTILKEIIEKIAGQDPSVIAIDLDLSPGAQELKQQDCKDYSDKPVQETELDCYLKYKKPENIKVVLQLPFPVYNDELRARKLNWMKDICNAGIEFGRVTFDVSYGMVTKIRQGNDRLGRTVCRFKESIGKDKIECNKINNKPYSRPICKILKNDEGNLHDAEYLLMPLSNEPRIAEKKRTPINFTFLSSFEIREINCIEEISDNIISCDDKPIKKVSKNENLKNKIVFLGGIYGESDRFNTPIGRIPGVMLIAADYYSQFVPITDYKITKILLIFSEIVLGIILAHFFKIIWDSYFHKKDEKIKLGSVNTVAFFWFASTILIVIGITAYLSVKFMSEGFLFNPAPMVFGMFVKVLVTSIDHGQGHDQIKYKCSIDNWLFRAVIIIAVILFFHELLCVH